MIDIIKQAGLDAFYASNPVNLTYGTVTSVNPLKVMIDQRLELTKEFLIVPEYLTEYKITICKNEKFKEEITIRKGLEVGNQLIMIRQQGGQEFLLLDRVVT